MVYVQMDPAEIIDLFYQFESLERCLETLTEQPFRLDYDLDYEDALRNADGEPIAFECGRFFIFGFPHEVARKQKPGRKKMIGETNQTMEHWLDFWLESREFYVDLPIAIGFNHMEIPVAVRYHGGFTVGYLDDVAVWIDRPAG